LKQALITGGAGFIGLHLARLLQSEGWRVDLVDDFSRAQRDVDFEALLRQERVRMLDGNLLDRTFVDSLERDYTEIFHLAAIVGVGNVLARPYTVLDHNIQLILNVIELARRQDGLQRFVFASTSEVYAGTLEYYDLPVPTPETVPITLPKLSHPRTSYMLSKLYGEALCEQAGLPFTIVRPHNVYGPRMGFSHVIPQLLERAMAAPADGFLDVYSVDHTRTFCFVEDAVQMILRLATSEAARASTVNIGTEAPELPIGRLAEIVIATVGKRLTIVPKPATEGSPRRRAPDMTRCAELTGYRSMVGIEKGVRETYAWYRERLPTAAGSAAR
jgi:nucleoside-diphosphate-sugar epimerase